MTVFGSRAYMKGIRAKWGHKGGPLIQSDLCPSKRRKRQSKFSPPPPPPAPKKGYVSTAHGRSQLFTTQGEAIPDNSLVGTLILNFQSPEPWENKDSIVQAAQPVALCYGKPLQYSSVLIFFSWILNIQEFSV